MPEPAVPAGHTILPGVIDHHVHLGLVDPALLAGGPVVEVHDLGWDPAVAATWREHPPAGVRVSIAGPFHTAPGGYPSGRSWAPGAAVCAVSSPAEAVAAVDRAASYGVDAIKVALHTGMPLLDDATLGELVTVAHAARLPVLIHAEGAGQAERAIAAGADVLVHAPWTDRVDDADLARGHSMTWISTLAIHDAAGRAVATDNIRRFRALGGRVVHGTDMGNGPTPVGVNADEIRALERAGLTGDDLLDAVVGPRDDVPPDRLLVSPMPLPATAEELVAWLGSARRLVPVPEGER